MLFRLDWNQFNVRKFALEALPQLCTFAISSSFGFDWNNSLSLLFFGFWAVKKTHTHTMTSSNNINNQIYIETGSMEQCGTLTCVCIFAVYFFVLSLSIHFFAYFIQSTLRWRNEVQMKADTVKASMKYEVFEWVWVCCACGIRKPEYIVKNRDEKEVSRLDICMRRMKKQRR